MLKVPCEWWDNTVSFGGPRVIELLALSRYLSPWPFLESEIFGI